MALDVNRWLHYAKARIERAVGQGNEELDRLEAEREVELADRPWLRADGAAPTLDEARARIEWEAEHQRTLAASRGATSGSDGGSEAGTGAGASTPPASTSAGTGTGTATAADAEQAGARLELERRERESAARLAQIRAELGVAAPPPEASDDAPPGP